jgi:hypothetical protein
LEFVFFPFHGLLLNAQKFNQIFLSLFIVRPHPDHFHRLDVIENLVDQAVLYVDSSGIGAGKISHEFLIWRGIPVRVFLCKSNCDVKSFRVNARHQARPLGGRRLDAEVRRSKSFR